MKMLKAKKTKYKKVRGTNRRLRNIDQWINHNKYLNLQVLETYQCEYVKFWVSPWDRLAMSINSQIPEPEGVFKEKFIQGLFEIYDCWKQQLDQLGKPYYLKIWLFEKGLRRSQIVCAIGEKIQFYENTFSQVENSDDQKYDFENLDNLAKAFHWEKRLDDLFIENDFLESPEKYVDLEAYLETKNYFENYVLQNYKATIPYDSEKFYYVLENDIIWLGQKT